MRKLGNTRIRRKNKNVVKKSRWAAYAAAGAATAFGAHEAAEAGIVYSGAQNIPASAPFGPVYSTVDTVIDLNGDAINDISFRHRAFTSAPPTGAAFALSASGNLNSNAAVAGFVPFYPYAYNLQASNTVGGTAGPGFVNSGTLAFTSFATAFGGSSQFTAAGTGFIGVRFDSAAGTHFGWIRVNMLSGAPANDLDIVDWAYESTPDTPIHVGSIPEPGSLGLLAAGAAGLVGWRRKRRNAGAIN